MLNGTRLSDMYMYMKIYTDMYTHCNHMFGVLSHSFPLTALIIHAHNLQLRICNLSSYQLNCFDNCNDLPSTKFLTCSTYISFHEEYVNQLHRKIAVLLDSSLREFIKNKITITKNKFFFSFTCSGTHNMTVKLRTDTNTIT